MAHRCYGVMLDRGQRVSANAARPHRCALVYMVIVWKDSHCCLEPPGCGLWRTGDREDWTWRWRSSSLPPSYVWCPSWKSSVVVYASTGQRRQRSDSWRMWFCACLVLGGSVLYVGNPCRLWIDLVGFSVCVLCLDPYHSKTRSPRCCAWPLSALEHRSSFCGCPRCPYSS